MTTQSTPAHILSMRIQADVLEKLQKLSTATGRTKSFLAAEAIENYLENQSWQIDGVKKAIKKANSKNAKFVEHNKVVDWVNSWRSKDEKEIIE